MTRLRLLMLPVALLGGLAVPRVSGAADGVIEINQDRVLAGNVTPGDPTGFPATITRPGSYRLTGDLAPGTGPLAAGIEVDLPSPGDVTIDLGGFRIAGGEREGIRITNVGTGTVRIRNGTIRSMGVAGIGSHSAGAHVEMEDLRILENGTVPVGPGPGGGIPLNIRDGIQVNGGSARIARVEAVGNARDGIRVDGTALIESCRVAENARTGIVAGGFGARIVDSVIEANGGTWAVVVAGESLLLRNVIRGNAGIGVLLNRGGGLAYGLNTFSDNGGDLELSPFTAFVRVDLNLCGSGSTTCSICGDAQCTGEESATSCPPDCPAVCGDGQCTHSETAATCPADCPARCGDGICTHDENVVTCPADCPASCGDGFCTAAAGEDCQSCEPDCGPCCGNGACEPGLGENTVSCPLDCSCGDGLCDPSESCETCVADCGFCALCGDGLCVPSEDCLTCPVDCGPCGPGGCGDLRCDPTEVCTCFKDCGPSCGNGLCDCGESRLTCPEDCDGIIVPPP